MSGYPVAHAVWMLYEIKPAVVRERIAPEIVRWQYRAGLIDPLRDSYWSDLYEVTSAGKAIFAAATSIPSTLREPDPRKIHGWDHRSGASSAPADSGGAGPQR
jgi:hypothetical protein